MRKTLVEIADTFREVFSAIWLWTIICALAITPLGFHIAFLIVGVVKLMLKAIYLDSIADWLCHSLSGTILGIEEQMMALSLDVIRIWVISYILISVISFVSYYLTNSRSHIDGTQKGDA